MPTEFAVKLRGLIDDRGVSDSLVARTVGVPPSSIGRWTKPVAEHAGDESVRRPTVPQLLALARFFGTSMEFLADDTLDHEPRADLTPEELAVLTAYRVQAIVEGPDALTPLEASLRLRHPSGRSPLPANAEGTGYSAGPAQADPMSRVKAG